MLWIKKTCGITFLGYGVGMELFNIVFGVTWFVFRSAKMFFL